MARGKFRQWVANRLSNIAARITRPETYAPPPLPTVTPEPKPQAPRPARPDRDVSRPPTRTRYIPRGDLPAEWGRNKAALWQDATKAHNNIGYDADAQAFYDAALYSFDEDPENRAAIMQRLKDYIEDTYGVDWDKIFDWQDYRANYDEANQRGTYAHGGVFNP